MFKKLLFFMFFSIFTSLHAQETWNFPAISISDENQDAIGAQVVINTNDKAIASWQRSDGSNTIIQTKYSTDGGSSWSSSPANLSASGENAGSSKIAMNISKAVAIWHRYDESNWIIQSKYSTNAGTSWSEATTNLSSVSQNANSPEIAMNNSSKAVAIWRRYNGSNYIIQTKYSTDGGANWNVTATDLSVVGQDSFVPNVVINDSDKAIAIWGRYDGSDFRIQVKYSTDGGANWNASPIDLSALGESVGACQIALNNSNEAIAIWTRYDGSNYIVQTKYSTDAGATWSPSASDLSDAGQDSRRPQIVLNNSSKAIAIWERHSGYNWMVQTKNSSDGGANWSLTATDLSVSGNKSGCPNITLTDSNNAIAIWKRHSGYNWIVQTKDSQDGGSTWNTSATDLSTAGQDGYQPEISINSSGQAVVIWPRFDGFKWVIQTINNLTAAYLESLEEYSQTN
ncbi:MAG: hypothetical protein KR126chlam5_00262 [Candidatus Anoxychlamydiales bacterium]|nr:hypothetical protein [Candidatus Anoxychlamydiales bacterium]